MKLHLERRQEWLDGRGDGKRQSMAKFAMQNSSAMARVQTSKGITTRITEDMGVLWPQALWNEHHPDELATPQMLTQVRHKGKIVRGVLRKEETHGFKHGCLRISVESTDACEMVEVAADSSTTGSAEQLQSCMAELTKVRWSTDPLSPFVNRSSATQNCPNQMVIRAGLPARLASWQNLVN